ncbi:MAG TPA: hypothetical protein VF761_09445 [Gemmatimonadaceae bacterium]
MDLHPADRRSTGPRGAPATRTLASRVASPLGVLLLLSLIPLVPAVRALFVGHDSFEPVLVGELYLWLFAGVWLLLPTFLHTVLRMEGWRLAAIIIAGVAGAMLLGALAPTIGEPNYCGYHEHYSVGLNGMPPRVYRCTSLPFEIVGGLLAWWGTYAVVRWWDARGG